MASYPLSGELELNSMPYAVRDLCSQQLKGQQCFFWDIRTSGQQGVLVFFEMSNIQKLIRVERTGADDERRAGGAEDQPLDEGDGSGNHLGDGDDAEGDNQRATPNASNIPGGHEVDAEGDQSQTAAAEVEGDDDPDVNHRPTSYTFWISEFRNGHVRIAKTQPWPVANQFGESATRDSLSTNFLTNMLTVDMKLHIAGTTYLRGAAFAELNNRFRDALPEAERATFSNVVTNSRRANEVVLNLPLELQQALEKTKKYNRSTGRAKANSLTVAENFFKAVHKLPLLLFLEGPALSSGATIVRRASTIVHAFVSYTDPIRSYDDFVKLLRQPEDARPDLVDGMARLEEFVSLTHQATEERDALAQTIFTPGRYGEEGTWSASDGDGASVMPGGDARVIDLRFYAIDAPEWRYQAGCDIPAAFMRTLWAAGFELKVVKLFYRYKGRYIAKVGVRTPRGAPNGETPWTDVSEVLLRCGLAYIYWPYLIGSEEEVVRLVKAFEAGHLAGIKAKNALMEDYYQTLDPRQPNVEICFPGDGESSADARSAWQSMKLEDQLMVTFTLNAWRHTLAYDVTIKAFKVKDEHIFGEASAVGGGGSILVDTYDTAKDKRLFNVWTVHQNEPVAVDVRIFPNEVRNQWGMNGEGCDNVKRAYLGTYPHYVKNNLSHLKSEVGNRTTTRNKRKGTMSDDAGMDGGDVVASQDSLWSIVGDDSQLF